MPTETETEQKRKAYRAGRIENITTQEIFDSLQSDVGFEKQFKQAAQNGNLFAMGAAAYAAMIADINLFVEQDIEDWLKEESTRDQLTREELRFDDRRHSSL